MEYTLVGDYYLPNLAPLVSPMVGRNGRMYLRHLKANQRARYAVLLLSGKLSAEIEQVDREAGYMMQRLVKDMAKAQGVTEQLKAADQMAWVGRMNNIRVAAKEIVLREVVYA